MVSHELDRKATSRERGRCERKNDKPIGFLCLIPLSAGSSGDIGGGIVRVGTDKILLVRGSVVRAIAGTSDGCVRSGGIEAASTKNRAAASAAVTSSSTAAASSVVVAGRAEEPHPQWEDEETGPQLLDGCFHCCY